MDTLDEIRHKINQGLSKQEAIMLLDNYLIQNPCSDEALTLRGLQKWGLGNKAAAINDYLKAIDINPDSQAQEALKVANDILNYYNKDLYNP